MQKSNTFLEHFCFLQITDTSTKFHSLRHYFCNQFQMNTVINDHFKEFGFYIPYISINSSSPDGKGKRLCLFDAKKKKMCSNKFVNKPQHLLYVQWYIQAHVNCYLFNLVLVPVSVLYLCQRFGCICTFILVLKHTATYYCLHMIIMAVYVQQSCLYRNSSTKCKRI